MIVGAFLCRDEAWILPLKLAALELFCHRIVIVLDRPTVDVLRIVYARAAAAITGYYVVHHHENTLGLPDEGEDGPICEEGRMRQEAWDLACKAITDSGYTLDQGEIVLGDVDEIPSPELVRDDHLLVPGEVALAPWVHLWKRPDRYIGGESIWSPSHPEATRKGVIVRPDPGKVYTYPDRYRHVRLEPPGLRAVEVDAPLVHWKWINWARWEGSYQAGLEKYQRFFDGMREEPVPPEWHWGLA